MSAHATAEIIAAGNELLLGDVLDTNTHWLCRQITGLGGQVTHAAMVGDDLAAISTEVHQSLDRAPSMLLTTGGLGPTTDDLTLVALAQALGVPLELSPAALALVRDWYIKLAAEDLIISADLTAEREKMAILPRGAQPLANPVGAAPGVLLAVGPTTIVALPGVPAELQGIFQGSLQSILREIFGEGFFLERVVIADCGDESRLAPIVAGVGKRHPGVYIKSRAQRFGPGVRIRVTLSMASDDHAEVERAIAQAVSDLQARLTAAEIASAME